MPPFLGYLRLTWIKLNRANRQSFLFLKKRDMGGFNIRLQLSEEVHMIVPVLVAILLGQSQVNR